MFKIRLTMLAFIRRRNCGICSEMEPNTSKRQILKPSLVLILLVDAVGMIDHFLREAIGSFQSLRWPRAPHPFSTSSRLLASLKRWLVRTLFLSLWLERVAWTGWPAIDCSPTLAVKCWPKDKWLRWLLSRRKMKRLLRLGESCLSMKLMRKEELLLTWICRNRISPSRLFSRSSTKVLRTWRMPHLLMCLLLEPTR